MDNLLSILTFIPLLAALILAIFLRGDDEAAQRNAKWLAVTATGATFFVALILLGSFDRSMQAFQFVEEREWPFGITFRMGVDGVSLIFIMTVVSVFPLAVAAAWGIHERVRDFIIALLVSETLFLGAFTSLDLAFFVLFFEGAVIPLALLAGLWGAKGAGHGALKMVVYALPGAILLIIALTAMARQAASTDITALLLHNYSSDAREVWGLTLAGGTQTLILLGLAWSIAVKAPLFPFHTWLPHLAAKASPGAILLVAALSTKLALYAVLRIVVPILPEAAALAAPIVAALALLTLVMAALTALVQEHMRKMLGYAAVATMGLPMLAAFTGTQQGIDGALMGAISHALTFAGLILVLCALETRLRTDEFDLMGGIRLRLPLFSLALLVFSFALFGLPGTAAFVMLSLSALGAYALSSWVGIGLAVGVVFLAALATSLYRRVALGDALRESVRTMPGLDGREKIAMGLAAAALIILGFAPGMMLDPAAPTTSAIVEQYQAGLQR